MPPVALTVASAPACLSSRRAAAVAPCPSTTEAVPMPALAPVLPEQPAARPHLRLVTAAASPRVDDVDEAEVIEIVHGHGGPASCRCRACTMARHPAALLPRLTVVR
ncbi:MULTISPECIES: hypothetical protein [unclassified Pseudofrankia]|uniref:hypothetical protein n=1 Tax=unclassified Pseudofrankia TaxID=2994372 RepID=UPI0008DAC4CA|nr:MULTISPECIES: hypothetical protein [unclassified Pseudofrankia]MDT3443751.1 hypothetical protein [Pseudofrankia sp. BMG5.37]OHV50028.1 hypothetical protein BCD48_11905 [Pseudofrankia sp. BMG5.36]